MDKNLKLVQLSQAGRFFQLDFAELSPEEQIFRAVWELESDVNNGGFAQYFSNSSGDSAFMVVDALHAIGAQNTARIVAVANGLFHSPSPSRDREERQSLLQGLTVEQRGQLDALDQQFLIYPDDLTELLHDFVTKNVAKIAGARDLGF